MSILLPVVYFITVCHHLDSPLYSPYVSLHFHHPCGTNKQHSSIIIYLAVPYGTLSTLRYSVVFSLTPQYGLNIDIDKDTKVNFLDKIIQLS